MQNLEQIQIPKNEVKAKNYFKIVKDKIINGEISALEVMVFFKKNHKIFESLKEDKEIKSIFEKEFENNKEGKSVKILGNRLTETSRSHYDYSDCNDPNLEELYNIQNRVEELIKEREKELKNLHPDNNKSNKFGINKYEIISNKSYELIEKEEETEVFSVNPPTKYSKTSTTFYV